MSGLCRVVAPALLLLTACSVVAEEAGSGGAERRLLQGTTQSYYLYLPSSYTPERDWPALVNIHPTDGDGRTMLLTWERYADEIGLVLVSPTFGPGYHRLAGGEDEILLAILDEVGKQVSLERRVLLFGFSGGAQFAHRFAFRHPERVRGSIVVAAGDYDPPPAGGEKGPFLVLVGEEDAIAPDRVALARTFVRQLQEAGYPVEFALIPGMDHQVGDPAVERATSFIRRLLRE